MKFLLGKKENMIQFFGSDGTASAATLVSAMPNKVTQVRTTDKDGYEAVQIGFGTRKEKNVSKAQKGHSGKLGNLAGAREYRLAPSESRGDSEAKVGDAIELDVFAEGDSVTVSGISKGKGFQGVVKRHGFHGGRRSHGQKHSEREAGSIGATGPQRVFKGKRMPGRMGSDRTTVKNLKVLAVDKEAGTLVISGALPGRRGTVLEIRSTST